MIISSTRISSYLIRTALYRAGIAIRSSSTNPTSLLADNSKSASEKSPPPYIPPGHDSGNGDQNSAAVNINSENRKPLIFMWPSREQPSIGPGTLIHGPEFDVIYPEEKVEKTKRRRVNRSHHFISNPEAEQRIIKYFLNNDRDLSNSSSIFCVYNAGNSKLPQSILDANASRLVILEPPKSEYLKKWEKFSMDPIRTSKTILKPFDFNRLAAGRVRDYHNNKGVDSLCQLFANAGAVSYANSENRDDWWEKENSDPPIRIIGVTDPYHEHGLLNSLLCARTTRSSIYEFGPVEVICAITPQQYVDFHPQSSDDSAITRKRLRVPKLVHWRARLYRHLFKIDHLFEEPFDSFSPKISTKSKLKYERISENADDQEDAKSKHMEAQLYEKLGIDKHKMHWISLKPQKCDGLENLISRDCAIETEEGVDSNTELERRRRFPHLSGLAYMHKLMARVKAKTSLEQFLRSYFNESMDDPRYEPYTKMNVGDMKLVDVRQIYEMLATDGGEKFFNSPLYAEAQEFVDEILCPRGLDEKKDGRRKLLV